MTQHLGLEGSLKHGRGGEHGVVSPLHFQAETVAVPGGEAIIRSVWRPSSAQQQKTAHVVRVTDRPIVVFVTQRDNFAPTSAQPGQTGSPGHPEALAPSGIEPTHASEKAELFGSRV